MTELFSRMICFLFVAGVVPPLASGDKEAQVKSEDFGKDLLSVQTLLAKQVSVRPSLFVGGL